MKNAVVSILTFLLLGGVWVSFTFSSFTIMETTPKKKMPALISPELEQKVQGLISRSKEIPADRKATLKDLAEAIQKQKQNKGKVQLIFICTHNSRRSHFSQIWGQIGAYVYGVDQNWFTFSGGTEATAFHPNAVAAVKAAGIDVQNPGGVNPHYALRFSSERPAMPCFSKRYDDSTFNPAKDFIAVMTCSHADANCPIVFGADARISLPYEDPKVSDGTGTEAKVYTERFDEIGIELLYLMSLLD
jgi:arsenate reductase (thioredoxin)